MGQEEGSFPKLTREMSKRKKGVIDACSVGFALVDTTSNCRREGDQDLGFPKIVFKAT